MTPPSGSTFLAPHTLGWPPPPHSSPAGHDPPSTPQETDPPHPSETTPQFIPALQDVTGVHPAFPPQLLGVPPPPHVAGALHVPQV
jgi:hypothetical protein